MGRQDLNEISSLFSQMSTHVAALARVSITQFSKEVITRQSLTSERGEIQKALQYKETIERDSTSLYDAMGQSVTSLAKSGSAGRILIVGTDGQENSSTHFSKETLKAAIAADKKLLVLMMRTFFADVSEIGFKAGAGATSITL